jgi:hypothetical protein
MRRFVLVLTLVGLLVVPAAGARVAARTPGSVYLQLTDGAGIAKVNRRGNFLGRVRRGRIVATRNVTLGGCAARRALSSTLVECRGRGITFRTPSDVRWRLRLRGHGIYASGFVHGCLTLNGVNTGYPGTFKIRQDGRTRVWPRRARQYGLGGAC